MSLRALLFAAVLGTTAGTVVARPDPATVLNAMERAADWQLAHPATNCTPFDWHNAAFYAGVMALVPLTESGRFHDAMVMMGEGNQWKLGPRTYHADGHAVGQTYVDLYLLDGGQERIAPMRETFDFILARNGAKIFWSRGNGWMMAGLVRVLELLPADHPDRGRYIRQFEEMAAKIITCQQDDGRWRSSLLDPVSYPMKETSGSAFFCYALAWGVNEGILDRRVYGDVALRAWAALNDCLEPDGRATHVQPVGHTPVSFDAQHTEAFGVGAFLLAGSEIHSLALSLKSRTE